MTNSSVKCQEHPLCNQRCPRNKGDGWTVGSVPLLPSGEAAFPRRKDGYCVPRVKLNLFFATHCLSLSHSGWTHSSSDQLPKVMNMPQNWRQRAIFTTRGRDSRNKSILPGYLLNLSIKTLLIISPCCICSETDINNAAEADNCCITAVNNSWPQASCDAWRRHRESRMSDVFLADPAAACGSGSDPFANLQLKLHRDITLYNGGAARSGLDARFVALCATTSSSLEPKLPISIHQASQDNSHLRWTSQICMKNQPLRESMQHLSVTMLKFTELE